MKRASWWILSIALIACSPKPTSQPSAPTSPTADLSAAARRLTYAHQLLGQGDLAGAGREAQEAARIRTKLLGPNHPDTGRAIWLLGWVGIAQKRPKEALPALWEAKRIFDANVIPVEERLAQQAHLVEALELDGDWNRVVAVAEQARSVVETARGPGPQSVPWLLSSAGAHRSACRPADALGASKRAVELAEAAAQPGLLAAALHAEAAVHQDQADLESALPLLELAAKLYASSAGRHAPQREVMTDLGKCQFATGRIKESQRTLEQARDIAMATCGGHTECFRQATMLWSQSYTFAADDQRATEILTAAGIAHYVWTAGSGRPPVRLPRPDLSTPFVAKDPRQCRIPRLGMVGMVGDASRVVANMRSGFRACYTEALASNPQLEVSVRMVGRIGADGTPTRVDVVHESRLEPLVVCLMGEYTRWRFDPPEGGSATVVIPVTLVQKR